MSSLERCASYLSTSYAAHLIALGATDFIRFMQQFNQGYGNYAEDRQQWQKNYSVNDILAEIEKG